MGRILAGKDISSRSRLNPLWFYDADLVPHSARRDLGCDPVGCRIRHSALRYRRTTEENNYGDGLARNGRCYTGSEAIEMSTATPNHALQRTAPRVTARAFFERSGSFISASVVRATVGHAPRYAPPSLSLGSFGDFAHLFRVMSASKDIPSSMPPTKPHGLKTSSGESIASPAVWTLVASRLFRSRRFQSSQASIASESDSAFARRLSRGGRAHTLHTQQLRASRQRGGLWLSSIACTRLIPAFQTFTFGHPSRVRACIPELFSGVCPPSNEVA